jgi:hypothetical protein
LFASDHRRAFLRIASAKRMAAATLR